MKIKETGRERLSEQRLTARERKGEQTEGGRKREWIIAGYERVRERVRRIICIMSSTTVSP